LLTIRAVRFPSGGGFYVAVHTLRAAGTPLRDIMRMSDITRTQLLRHNGRLIRTCH